VFAVVLVLQGTYPEQAGMIYAIGFGLTLFVGGLIVQRK
jgi:hypothetical protein